MSNNLKKILDRKIKVKTDFLKCYCECYLYDHDINGFCQTRIFYSHGNEKDCPCKGYAIAPYFINLLLSRIDGKIHVYTKY